jgi:hypothetical protein
MTGSVRTPVSAAIRASWLLGLGVAGAFVVLLAALFAVLMTVTLTARRPVASILRRRTEPATQRESIAQREPSLTAATAR